MVLPDCKCARRMQWDRRVACALPRSSPCLDPVVASLSRRQDAADSMSASNSLYERLDRSSESQVVSGNSRPFPILFGAQNLFVGCPPFETIKG